MYTDLHISIGLPFEITLTNYTTKIESALYNIHFLKNAQKNQVFATYSKLKSDVKKKPIEYIDPGEMRYYQTGFNFLDSYADQIYNVDIKSAYATILFNDGIISKPTFEYIKKLSKIDRLAAVGMLAGKKNIFKFNALGKLEECREEISETSSYFFYAVKKTFEIMDVLKMELGNDFIFSWVDGIYFGGEENGPKLQNILLNEYGLNSSFDTLTEFEVMKKSDHYLLQYLKDEDKKVFSIPFPDNTHKQEIYKFLINKKYDK